MSNTGNSAGSGNQGSSAGCGGSSGGAGAGAGTMTAFIGEVKKFVKGSNFSVKVISIRTTSSSYQSITSVNGSVVSSKLEHINDTICTVEFNGIPPPNVQKYFLNWRMNTNRVYIPTVTDRVLPDARTAMIGEIEEKNLTDGPTNTEVGDILYGKE